MVQSLNIRFVKVLLTGILLSFIILTEFNTVNAASCTISVNWSSGHCSICGGPTGNYACNPPWSGSGGWGPINFADCIPAGNILTQVCMKLAWVGCTGSVTLQLNGTNIGTTVVEPACPCGGCAPAQTLCTSFPCPGGWPGYNYGGTNTITPINNGTVCIDLATITLTYSPTTPPTPGTISGPTSPCVGSVQTYSISAVSGATSYSWVVPGGWTINSGQGTTSISVTVGATAGTVCVSSVNSCGSSSQQCLNVTPVSGPAAPGSITGSTTPCVGSTTITYSISAVSGATSYTWTVPAGWTITAGQGTTSITVTVGSASGNVCVRACNSCGCSAFTCVAVTPSPVPAAPGAISGPVSPCSGTTQTYSISAVSGATSYQWTVPGGWVILSGQGTTSILVLVGIAGGNVCVRACNGCGCSAFTCKAVIPGTAPGVPISINGPASVCPGATNTYSITAIPGATSYSWVVPTGSTINSGQGTTSISVTAGGTSGNLTVQACNSCGCGTAQTLAVIVSTLSLSASATNESCNGGCDGTTSVAVSGGTGPYTYAWTGGCATSSCSALCAGAYSVMVSDAGGCTAISSTTILAGPPVLAGFSYNGNQCLTGNNLCFTNTGSTGGTVTFNWDFGDGTFTGVGLGTSPLPGPNPSGTYENPCYTYSTSGSFTVTQTVADGACSDVAFFGIVVYSEPTASIIGTDMACNGVCTGAADLTVNGGQSPYTYAWSSGPTIPDITGLCAGIYTVTVTDANSCMVTATYTVIEPPLLTNTPSGTNVSCNGLCDGTATATAGGGTTPYTYIWDDPGLQTNSIATGLCAGTFNSTVTDANGCTATSSQVINQPAAMILTFTTVDAACGANDGSACVAVTGGTAPYTYLWDDSGAQTDSCAITLFGGGYNVLVTDVNACTNTGAVTVNTSVSVSATITDSTMVSCNGGADGTATVSAAGGSSPYTYTWNTIPSQTNTLATGMSAGTWTASVLDAVGCADAITVVITEPALLSAAILTFNDPNCFGGADGDATVTSSGGTGSYTYSWSPLGGTGATGTGLAAGVLYTVTVNDALSCNTTATITLGEPTVLNLSITGTDPLCNGGSDGSADLTVTGGSPGYNYSWSNGPTSEDITNVIAGSYTVTVTDLNGCSDNETVVLGEPTAIVATTTVVDAYCGLANGSVCVTTTGGTGAYTYLWNDPGSQTDSCAVGLFGGITYGVTVTDVNSCTGTATDIVNDLPGGVTTITLNNNASGFGICDGAATGTMTGGIGPYTYSWDDPLLQSTATADSLCAGTVCITIIDGAGCVSTDCITITEPSGISDTIVGTNVDCNGNCNGEADLSVVGGVPPYTYLWTPGNMVTEDLIGLCAGTYVVLITDANSVTSSNSIVITEPLTLAVSMSGNPANCNNICDGDATGVASGGTAPYTYLWDDSGTQTTSQATGLCDGTYTIILSDSLGCTTSNTFTVTEPLAVLVTTTVTNATCGQSDGTATANTTNGVGALTYIWDDLNTQTNQTATGITSGTYGVTVTDANGCIGSGSAAVSDDLGPVGTITDSTNTSCFGVCDGSATVAASSGTPPYTYLWSPTGQTTPLAVNLCAGAHVAEITDATGCTSTTTVTITEPADLIATGAVLIDPNCNGSCDGVANVIVSGGTSPYTYQWDDPNLQTTINATGLCAGTINIVVTDANGCTGSDNLILVEPAALSLTLTTVDAGCNGDATGSATVVVTGGTSPYTYSWSNGDNGQIADSLSAGIYNIQVTDANLCAVISSVTINEPNSLVASIFATQDVDCNGNCTGFATVTQSGGTSPYTYLWSDGQPAPTAVALCPGVYNVTVSDANGCTDITTATIIQPNAMNLSMTKTDVLCNGACDGTATITVAGGSPPYNYQWNDVFFQTTSMADSLCDGPFQVIVTDTAGCTAFANVLIVQPNALSIIVSSIDSSNCGNQDGGACVNIAGGDVPYFVQWSAPGLPIGTCIDSVYAGVYTVYVVDINFCFDSMLIPINDIGAAIIDSIATVDDNCYGDSIGSATVVSVSNATGAITYLWKDGNGDTLAMGVGASSIANLGGGTYSVTIIDGGTGCLTTEIVVINQPSPVYTTITLSNTIDISCNGLCDGRLTVSQSGGTLPYTYSWLPTSTDVTPMADSLCAGMHIVVVTDADGCVDSSSAVIVEPAALTAIATVTDISCYGGADGIIDLLPTPTGGTAPWAYTWFPAGTAGNVPTATNLVAGTDTVVITDFRGCTDTVIATITEPSELIIDTSVTVADNCGSGQGSATVTPTGGTPAYTYSWNTPPTPQTDSMATGLLAGVYDVTVTDASGCSSNGPVTVPGTPGPIIDSAVVVDVACNGGGNGSAQILVSSGTAPFTYTWNTTPIQTNATATGLSGGQYITTVTDASGCQDIKIVTVAEPAAMALLTFQDKFLICDAESAQITIVPTGGIPPYQYNWNNGLPNLPTHSVSPNTYTWYVVLVTDSVGCSATDSLEITVNPPLSITSANVEICDGQTAVLSAFPTDGNGGPYTVTWSDGTNSTSETVVGGDSSTVSQSPSSTTNFTVVVSDGCSYNDTIAVAVILSLPPVAAFYSVDTVGCSITFIDTSKGFTSTSPTPSDTLIVAWEWDFGDNTVIGPGSGLITGSANTTGMYNNPTHFYSSAGSYSVTVTVTDYKGCTNSLTFTNYITVSPPTAAFSQSPDPATLGGNPPEATVIFTDLSVDNIASWAWDFGDTASPGNNSSNLQHPVHVYSDSGDYNVTLVVQDVDGCVSTITRVVSISLSQVLYIPNIFAPDDPAKSSTLFVSGIGIKALNLVIYDRWGEKIFETSNAIRRDRADGNGSTFGDGWDGTKGGKELAPQVFVYYLKATFQDGEEVEKKGNITLVK